MFEYVIETIDRKQRTSNLFGVTHRFDKATPGVMDMSFGLELTHTTYDLSRCHESVVGLIGLGPMPGSAPHLDPNPKKPLFSDYDRELQAIRAGQRNTARFGDDVIGHDGFSLMGHQILSTVRTIRFLVGNSEIHKRAAWRESRPCQSLKCHGHRRCDVEHVDCTSTPNLAVDKFTPEWIARPMFWIHRNNIGVTHQEKSRSGQI